MRLNPLYEGWAKWFPTLAGSDVGGSERPMDPKRAAFYSQDRHKTCDTRARGSALCGDQSAF